MTIIPTFGEVIPQGGRETGGLLNPGDDRLADLTPETGAVLIGYATVAEVEALAPAEDRPYIRAALTDRGAVERALNVQSVSRKGTLGPATREQRVERVLEHAANARRAAERAEAYRARRDADTTCEVLGRPDPTTKHRQPPWGGDGTVKVSLIGYELLKRAWLEQIGRDRPAEDRARRIVRDRIQ